jgi:hypothetical protein
MDTKLPFHGCLIHLLSFELLCECGSRRNIWHDLIPTQTTCAEDTLFLLRNEMMVWGWETGGARFLLFLTFHWRNTQLHGTLG